MKLIEALAILAANASRISEPMKTALVSGFTPLHLLTFLQAELQLLFPSQRIEVTTGSYGDIPGTLKGLRGKEVDAIALVLEWEDLDSRLGIRQLGAWTAQTPEDVIEQASMRLSLIRLLLEELRSSAPVVVSLPTLPLPPLFSTSGWQSSPWSLKLREQLAAFAATLGQHRRVRFLSEQRLNELSPPAQRLDVKSTWAAGFPYRMEHASVVAALLARLIKNPLPQKGLITDLDNVLWSGIVGEVGAEQITWDLDHHRQGHALYQQFLRELSEEGALIAAVSKNDPAVVEEAFQRKDLLLPATRIFPFEVSWGSKATAVSAVLSQWNIGADSVVFVDDDPLELAEVKAAHPEVTCLQFPRKDPQAIYNLLVQLRDLFGKAEISEEDRLRLESMRSRATEKTIATGVEGFSEALLEQAGAELTFSLKKDAGDARALELINKTNQFNVNGRRFTEAAWQSHLRKDETFLLTASYKDRFGSLGRIAVVSGRVNGSALHVETWVMSCRAFARRIEHQCLRFLFDRFRCNSISFDYQRTERNGPLAAFLEQVNGEPPTSTVELLQDRFAASCPKLFHTVAEIADD